MEILVHKKVNGVPMVEFVPTPKMRLFAYALFCDARFSGRSNEDICRELGIGASAYKKFQQYNPYFEEWLEEVSVLFGGRNKKMLLEFVGMEKALRGDFQFWKPLAIREGVISPDQLNHGAALPANLGGFGEMNDEQLSNAKDSILATLRGVENPGPIDLAEGPGGWEQAGDSQRTVALPERSLVLAPSVGVDRELPFQDEEPV